MRVAHIIPGTGGTFYCQNCMRDSALMRGLKHRGSDREPATFAGGGENDKRILRHGALCVLRVGGQYLF